MHIIILEEEELTRKATVRNFRTVQMEGLREREVELYNLYMIIALDYRIRSLIATSSVRLAM